MLSNLAKQMITRPLISKPLTTRSFSSRPLIATRFLTQTANIKSADTRNYSHNWNSCYNRGGVGVKTQYRNVMSSAAGNSLQLLTKSKRQLLCYAMSNKASSIYTTLPIHAKEFVYNISTGSVFYNDSRFSTIIDYIPENIQNLQINYLHKIKKIINVEIEETSKESHVVSEFVDTFTYSISNYWIILTTPCTLSLIAFTDNYTLELTLPQLCAITIISYLMVRLNSRLTDIFNLNTYYLKNTGIRYPVWSIVNKYNSKIYYLEKINSDITKIIDSHEASGIQKNPLNTYNCSNMNVPS